MNPVASTPLTRRSAVCHGFWFRELHPANCVDLDLLAFMAFRRVGGALGRKGSSAHGAS